MSSEVECVRIRVEVAILRRAVAQNARDSINIILTYSGLMKATDARGARVPYLRV